MIFGNDSKATIIVASNILGYDNFTGEDFIKPFEEGEVLEMLYPPDHGSSGSYYLFDTSLGATAMGILAREKGRNTQGFPEDTHALNPDAPFPYQSLLDIVYYPTFNSGMRPLSDRSLTGDNGVDAFFLKGSVIRGRTSGAKRFYAGPFKGFTKEIECVCDGGTAVNNMDGMDCKGYLKGSYYEQGYDPTIHNLFNYSDEPRTIVNHVSPLNSVFMNNTPYGGLDMSCMNLRDRFKRPIPYRMPPESGKSSTAVLISKRHAAASTSLAISENDLRFFSKTQGIVSATIASTATTFKQMWDAIGFIDENRDADTLNSFNQMKAHFDGIQIITLNQEMPSDVQPIRLLDPNTSNSIFYSMAISHEGRGHVGIFCPPLGSTTYSPTQPPQLKFAASQNCESFVVDSFVNRLPTTIGIADSDIGSAVITHHDNAVFMGFITSPEYTTETIYPTTVKKRATIQNTDPMIGVKINETNLYKFTNRPYLPSEESGATQRSIRASIVGVGLGSSKEIQFPWGISLTPHAFLNMYLALANAQSTSESVTGILHT